MSVTREEHLQWCKARALEYVAAGDLQNGFASFQSDMRKHEATRDHVALELMTRLFFAGHLAAPGKMQKFIEGFN